MDYYKTIFVLSISVDSENASLPLFLFPTKQSESITLVPSGPMFFLLIYGFAEAL